VFGHPFEQIAGDAGVKNLMTLVCHNVDAGMNFSFHGSFVAVIARRVEDPTKQSHL
jgi:hypothetical protein